MNFLYICVFYVCLLIYNIDLIFLKNLFIVYFIINSVLVFNKEKRKLIDICLMYEICLLIFFLYFCSLFSNMCIYK